MITSAALETGLYWRSADEPWRRPLVDALRKAFVDDGCSSLLEVGCNTGPVLRLLRRLDVEATYIGIDADADVIAAAQSLCVGHDLQPAGFYQGVAPVALDTYEYDAFDVALTSSCLMSMKFLDARATLARLSRIATRRLIVFEQKAEELVALAPTLAWAPIDSRHGLWVADLTKGNSSTDQPWLTAAPWRPWEDAN